MFIVVEPLVAYVSNTILIIILQEVQQEIKKMIEEVTLCYFTSESDDDDDLSHDTVEGTSCRIQCSCDMLILCGECVQ